jgi:hypothetical protein
MAVALDGARADLAGVVEATIGAVEKEQARLVATGRAISLVRESLLGRQHIPRL